jgi:hypothetical protein
MFALHGAHRLNAHRAPFTGSVKNASHFQPAPRESLKTLSHFVPDFLDYYCEYSMATGLSGVIQ